MRNLEKPSKVLRAYMLVTLLFSMFLAKIRTTDRAAVEMDIKAIFTFAVLIIMVVIVASIALSLTTPGGQSGYSGIGLALANAIASPFLAIGNGIGSFFNNLFGGLGSAVSKALGGL